ncbi:hypothetical protein DAEQUDRAFT_731721 [Daedalea quercina L-15889]|uniref:Uncharacterized protein n=1 Tax=Daedalea quercina L-15889 TaxID=1314783 RepID=A0A165M3Y6_9APHY|nr:hypothetical protein DAEQUDRAFT_731721 [Daedalea quercina L-15889]
MGLFGGSKPSTSEDPEIRQAENMLASETKNKQKNLDHALKDLAKLDKRHENSIKAADKAQRTLDKAVKDEHKAAKELNQAEYKHDNAISTQRNASKDLELKRQNEGSYEQDLQQRKASIDELQQRKAASDATGESKLAQIHQRAADRASASIDLPTSGEPSSAGSAGTNDAVQGAGTDTTTVDANEPAVGSHDRM